MLTYYQQIRHVEGGLGCGKGGREGEGGRHSSGRKGDRHRVAGGREGRGGREGGRERVSGGRALELCYQLGVDKLSVLSAIHRLGGDKTGNGNSLQGVRGREGRAAREWKERVQGGKARVAARRVVSGVGREGGREGGAHSSGLAAWMEKRMGCGMFEYSRGSPKPRIPSTPLKSGLPPRER